MMALAVPTITALQREIAGTLGAFLALGSVALLAIRRDFSPATLLLTGMVVSFIASAVSVVIALFHHDYLRAVFIWASGSMIQNDFSAAIALFQRLIILVPLLALLVRPLTLAGLDDATARSLGLNITTIRIVSLLLATALCAVVVARIGVIAFVGLAAPHLARLAGADSFRSRLIWAPLFGALLLLLADGLVLLASRHIAEVPTGTVTALSGALLLLVMLRRMPAGPKSTDQRSGSERLSVFPPYRILLTLLIAVAVLISFSLTEQLLISSLSVSELVAGRWPRILAAGSAGAMLAVAGAVMQSVTGNPLASPEGLGVSAGAGLGVVAAFFLAGTSPLVSLAGGTAGAFIAFFIIITLARAGSYAAGTVLLAGVAIGTFASALIALIIASGDPRAALVLAWTMGPTFRANAVMALTAAAFLAISLLILPLFLRWLEVLPLGDNPARALGLSPAFARRFLLFFCAVLTGAATLVVGPLSFVGLMAPHIARTLVPGRVLPGTLCAAATGALLMTGADWLGRSIDFPYEIPAGVLAAFIGGPYFLWRLYRQAL
jgi:iron complex transport system permease protein